MRRKARSLDSVADIQYNHHWRAAIAISTGSAPGTFRAAGRAGRTQRNIPAALNLLGLEHNNNKENNGLPPTILPSQKHRVFSARGGDFAPAVSAARAKFRYKLIDNGGYTDYENDLQNIHISALASGKLQRLSKTRILDTENVPLMKKNYSITSGWRISSGIKRPSGLFLLNIFSEGYYAGAYIWNWCNKRPVAARYTRYGDPIAPAR